MSTHRYKYFTTDSQRTSFSPNDSLKLTLSLLEGEAFSLGAYEHMLNLRLRKNGSVFTSADVERLYVDILAGIQRLYERYDVSHGQGRVVQRDNYAGSVKSRRLGGDYSINRSAQLDLSSQLMNLKPELQRALLGGEKTSDGFISFRIKPSHPINDAIGSPIGYSRLPGGYFVDEISLCAQNALLYGSSNSSDITWTVENLEAYAYIVPDNPEGRTIIDTVENHARELTTKTANFYFKISGGKTAGFWGFTTERSKLASYTENSLSFDAVPAIPYGKTSSRDNYGFSELNVNTGGLTTALFSQPLRSQEEIVENAIEAIRGTSDNTKAYGVTLRDVNMPISDGYMFGVNFGGFYDFSRNPIGIHLKSNVSSSSPYRLTFNFRKRIEM